MDFLVGGSALDRDPDPPPAAASADLVERAAAVRPSPGRATIRLVAVAALARVVEAFPRFATR